MYRNCYYDTKTSTIHEFTWDSEGKRITLEQPVKPFLFVECNYKSNYKSIYGTSLEMRKFDNTYSRYKFVNGYENKKTGEIHEGYDGRIFFNLPPEQQYLIHKYQNTDKSKFQEHDLRVFFLDIECPSENEFPAPETAKYEIDLMTVYDSLEGIYHVWGKQPYENSSMLPTFESIGGSEFDIPTDKIKYYEIFEESDRLEHFLQFWEENTPDIYTGWNINNFDTPYLINRIKLILGTGNELRLSPVKNIYKRDTFDKFKNPVVKYTIYGISVMDYMDVFKTFTFGAERESWSLDAVASDILKCGKLDTGGISLYDLARKDWDTYTRYNIIDVALLVEMDNKLDFLGIGRSTAYEGFSNIVDCLGKIATITGSIAKYALDKRLILETRKPSEKQSFEGGYVKTPEAKLRTNIATYDITSLYPTNMMVLGVSLETKVGKVISRNNGLVQFTEWGKCLVMEEEKFHKYLKDNKYCISLADVIFDQKRDGIINQFVTTQFNNKAEYSKKSKEAKLNGDDALANEYARLGQITKIFLNSCYGVISANKSPLYDLDIARSITLTGQGVIKKAAELADNFGIANFGIDEPLVIGGDTDSIFLDFTPIVNARGTAMFDGAKFTTFGKNLCKIYETVLNDGVNKWISEEHYCINPTYNFEREKAATTALFFAKKQYAYYVVNNEGFDLPPEKRMKYTGLKVVRSEYSSMVKGMMNELYETVLSRYLELGHKKCRSVMVDLVREHKLRFSNATFFDISKRQKVNNIAKYEEMFTGEFTAGLRCPAQVKASVCYNRLVKKLKLTKKYEYHRGGIKSMWVYVNDNKYGITNCAGFNGVFPEEFNLEIDIDKQFEKLYLAVAKQLFAVVGWEFPNIHYRESYDMNEMLT